MADKLLKTIRPDEYFLFLNFGTKTVPLWASVTTAQEFQIELNPEISTVKYWKSVLSTNNLTSYNLKISQEVETISGDVAFDYLQKMLYDLPTGQSAVREMLVIMPYVNTEAEEKAKGMASWKSDATISFPTLNVSKSTLVFNIDSNGTLERGNSMVTDGKPVFTAVTETPSAPSTPESATFSKKL